MLENSQLETLLGSLGRRYKMNHSAKNLNQGNYFACIRQFTVTTTQERETQIGQIKNKTKLMCTWCPVYSVPCKYSQLPDH